ncbi:MAG: hypothetical protein QGI70_04705 [Paracoccaceae bacterium]|jgi:hypothetical protein|nr:hypothetical protein [Paracoccaceae bacterium]
MTPPSKDEGFVRMPEEDFEAVLARAAEKGARDHPDKPLSTQRRQSGILVHVHSTPPNKVVAW